MHHLIRALVPMPVLIQQPALIQQLVILNIQDIPLMVLIPRHILQQDMHPMALATTGALIVPIPLALATTGALIIPIPLTMVASAPMALITEAMLHHTQGIMELMAAFMVDIADMGEL